MVVPGTSVVVRLAERSYTIHVAAGLLDSVGLVVRQATSAGRAVVVTDDHVRPHAQRAARGLQAEGLRVDVLAVPPGEGSKRVAVAEQLWEQMLDLGIDRTSVVVAVGGGVVGDLAGFVAATYSRGLDFVQVPTTLLAQVDSSVGGKVGVNLPRAKNMLGAFWQPRAVVIDPQLLATLPDREYAAGLAEVVKYGVIADAELFASLESQRTQLLERHGEVLERVIARCCRLKADVVEADERETSGRRAILNYGHTFAHALEAVAGYGELLHGEAVAVGMICASRLAERLGRIGPEVTDRQLRLLAALGLPTSLPDVPPRRLLEAMRHDKKAAHGQLRFVLPSRLGHVELVGDVEPSLVESVLGS